MIKPGLNEALNNSSTINPVMITTVDKVIGKINR
jgi:hypothetical protein